MAHLGIRISDDLCGRLDKLVEVRGLPGRSEAVRLAIREAAMTPEERAAVPDRDELLRLLGVKARDGNVAAMKALLEEQRRGADQDDQSADPFAEVDELSRIRAARTTAEAGRA